MTKLNLTEHEILYLQEAIPNILGDYTEDDSSTSVFNSMKEVKTFMDKIQEL